MKESKSVKVEELFFLVPKPELGNQREPELGNQREPKFECERKIRPPAGRLRGFR